MSGTSGRRCSGQEYVTDWRMVYSAVGVVAIMAFGGLAWALIAPTRSSSITTSAAKAHAADSDGLHGVTAREAAIEAEAVEIVVPWAELPDERRLPPEATQTLAPDETAVPDEIKSLAKPEPEITVLASVDEATHETHAATNFQESSRADEFAAELERAVTLDFNPIKATLHSGRGVTRTVTRRPSSPLTQEQQFAQLANPSDLAGLPILGEHHCHKSEEDVGELARVSQRMASIDRNRRRQQSGAYNYSAEYSLEQGVFQFLSEADLEKASVAPLVQILQVHEVGVRSMLVNALSSIEGPEASRALADRALFDLSRDVRLAAIRSLQRRDRTEYRPRLLTALRYPLAAVAFRAAETLVASGDADVLPTLVELLDEPDPTAPFAAADGTLQKTELVRVNHLRNCLLCHPRSGARNEKVRAAVPTPGQPLPRIYYQTSTGDAVHADVTYLQQDFSAMQRVVDHGPWPEMQRFDFLLRTRSLTEAEQQAHTASADAKVPGSYPQREAVLFAIKGLSQLDS